MKITFFQKNSIIHLLIKVLMNLRKPVCDFTLSSCQFHPSKLNKFAKQSNDVKSSIYFTFNTLGQGINKVFINYELAYIYPSDRIIDEMIIENLHWRRSRVVLIKFTDKILKSGELNVKKKKKRIVASFWRRSFVRNRMSHSRIFSCRWFLKMTICFFTTSHLAVELFTAQLN